MRRHCLLSTPSPHVPTTPFSFTLFLCRRDGVAGTDSGGSTASRSLVNSDNRYRTKLRGGERVERWRAEEAGGEGRSDIQRCCVCLLPASCYSCLPLCRRNWLFPLTAPVPLSAKEKLVSPQHAVISRSKNTGQQMHRMPGFRCTPKKKRRNLRGYRCLSFPGVLNVPWWKQSSKRLCSFPHYAVLTCLL